MLKFAFSLLTILFSMNIYAESLCDVRPGVSVGVNVMEFFSGNTIHSKMTLKESTPNAILEEMISLQDMGICEEKILAKKCILKYEAKSTGKLITLYRGPRKWNSWSLNAKTSAQNFVRELKKAGFCS